MKSKIGVLILGVLLSAGGLVRAVPVNSNSVVIDDIEFYVQTDKAVYDLGESVQMLFRVTNLRSTDVTIGCSRSGEFNLLVRNDNEDIWALLHWFKWWMPIISLPAGESTNLSPYMWNMQNDAGNLFCPAHILWSA